ncbi:MAG TPA: VanZ family protein [Polyangia bacterium]|nr:VanZ family protein [Polyangia bacterium]
MAGSWSSGWRAWVPALVWSAGIFVLSSIPGSAFPQLPGWWHADKFVHLGIYATLGALCWYGARGTLPPGRGAPAQVLVAFLVTALYGVTDEAHQAFTPLRSPDPYDVLADAVGGLAGALACVAIVARKRKRA